MSTYTKAERFVTLARGLGIAAKDCLHVTASDYCPSRALLTDAGFAKLFKKLRPNRKALKFSLTEDRVHCDLTHQGVVFSCVLRLEHFEKLRAADETVPVIDARPNARITAKQPALPAPREARNEP